MDHTHVTSFQTHVGTAKTEQEQREEQNSADNQQDLEAFQRWFGHRRGRQSRHSADGNQIRAGRTRFWMRRLLQMASILDAADN